jgi:8-oxo-dGTP diphosphatase
MQPVVFWKINKLSKHWKRRVKKVLENLKSGPKNDYPDRARIAVGAIVFKNTRVLLVRRAQPPSRDKWAIPGGSVEIGETLQEAAEREILEETGLTIRAGKPVYTFDFIERDDAGRVRFHYVIVDLEADYISGEPCPGDDAAEARWISAQEIKSFKVSSMTLKVLKTCFDFGPGDRKKEK